MSNTLQTTETKFVEANELFDLTLKSAGGLDRWNKAQSIDVSVSLIGKLFQLKGFCGLPDNSFFVDHAGFYMIRLCEKKDKYFRGAYN